MACTRSSVYKWKCTLCIWTSIDLEGSSEQWFSFVLRRCVVTSWLYRLTVVQWEDGKPELMQIFWHLKLRMFSCPQKSWESVILSLQHLCKLDCLCYCATTVGREQGNSLSPVTLWKVYIGCQPETPTGVYNKITMCHANSFVFWGLVWEQRSVWEQVEAGKMCRKCLKLYWRKVVIYGFVKR